MKNIKTTEIKQLKVTNVLRIAILSAVVIIGGIAAFGCSNSGTNLVSNTTTTKSEVINSATPAVNSATIPAKSLTDKVPVPLSDAGEYGENTYDMAKAKDWTKAAEKVLKLKQSQSQLAGANIKSAELDAAIAALDKDVAAKDQPATLRDSNQVTFIVADLTAKYSQLVPVEVVKLDYYGRELEIWSMAKDEAKLKSTAQAIRKTWDAVKPKVEAKGGTKQAQSFEMLVAKTDAAKNIEDYAKVAKPILDEVDNLEGVFEK